ncbi:MAG: N-acetylmuramoyl-L-alanine amidase [Sphingomicrobium sp.]
MAYGIKDGKLLDDSVLVDQIPSPYCGSNFATNPKIVVIHFTAGGSARSSAEWFRHPANPGSSAHIVIDRDGSIIQCVSFKKIAWHAGRSRWKALTGMNQHAYGIELANWGNLKSAGSGWTSSTGVRIDEPVLAAHRNGNPNGVGRAIGWEPYPEKQFVAAGAVVRSLVENHGVTEIVGHDDIAPTRKWDPGPAFDLVKFRTLVFGDRRDDGDNIVTVRAAGGLNLRAGPGTHFAALELLPNRTSLVPTGTDGRWIEVNVLAANGSARATGWVHGSFVSTD